jgi:hypothetical protein
MNSFDPDPRPKRTSLGFGDVIRLALLGAAADEDDGVSAIIHPLNVILDLVFLLLVVS